MIELRTVTLTRDLPHPPAKVWRAITDPALMAEWLLKSDFRPETGHDFRFETGFGGIDCSVLEVSPEKRLVYSWTALGLESVVTFTLTPTAGGTTLRMDQSGFRPDQEQAFRGAHAGWRRFIDALAALLDR